MANRNDKNPGNVPGPWYVDTSCIDCDLCRDVSPQIFARNEEIGMSTVCHQPVTPEDLRLAREAMESCPSESIGNDGD